LKNKVVLITGATDGIGKQTAIDLAAMNASIILHGRSEARLLKTRDKITRLTNNSQIEIVNSDFASLEQVKSMAEEIRTKFNKMDVLINNAGVYMTEKKLTEDGYEFTFAVNHLGHFLLTNLLIDLLKKQSSARIINVSSVAHSRARLDFDNIDSEKSFDSYNAYAVSKLANVLYTYELARRLQGTNVTVNALHPGVISTKLLWAGFRMKGATVSEGAETSVYLASSGEVNGITAKYFVRKRETASSESSYNIEYQSRMWEASEQMIGRQFNIV
jgi:NAD(P)-dependent dehydrogenase (short-subunit alcohol dehydrogenase family)